MTQEQMTDAINRIDKVVTDFRSSDAGQSFKWVVKPQYQPEPIVYFLVSFLTIAFFIIDSDPANWTNYITLVCLGWYWAIIKCFKFFQEKEWPLDYISKPVLFCLCENEFLKSHITKTLRDDQLITYTKLVEIKEKIKSDLKKKAKKRRNRLSHCGVIGHKK